MQRGGRGLGRHGQGKGAEGFSGETGTGVLERRDAEASIPRSSGFPTARRDSQVGSPHESQGSLVREGAAPTETEGYRSASILCRQEAGFSEPLTS